MDASSLRIMTLDTESSQEGAMRPPHHILDRQQVHRLAAEHLQAHLQVPGLQAQDLGPGPLVAVARRRRPDHLAVRRLPAPARRPLRRDGPQGPAGHPARLRRRCNGSSTPPWPGTCPRPCAAPQRLAIDLTLIPYHGQPFRDLDEIYRGQAKDGTSHFHAYATAYVVRHGQRYTVALTGVTEGRTAQGGGPTPAPPGRAASASGPACCCWIAASTAWRWSATSRRRGTRS